MTYIIEESIFQLQHDLFLESTLTVNPMAVSAIPFCGPPCRSIEQDQSETQHFESTTPGRAMNLTLLASTLFTGVMLLCACTENGSGALDDSALLPSAPKIEGYRPPLVQRNDFVPGDEFMTAQYAPEPRTDQDLLVVSWSLSTERLPISPDRTLRVRDTEIGITDKPGGVDAHFYISDVGYQIQLIAVEGSPNRERMAKTIQAVAGEIISEFPDFD